MIVMNNELSLRTLGYLIGYYKSHNETIINLQEIEAINFILDENEKLQQENNKLKEENDKLKYNWNDLKEYLRNRIVEWQNSECESIKEDCYEDERILSLMDYIETGEEIK